MALFDLHHPLLFTFGILGNIVSFFVYFAPLPTFMRIYKEKSTLGFQSIPYVVALFSATLWMYYALLKTNTFLLITINSFGCVIETVYISLFLFYANRKARRNTIKLVGGLNVGLFALIFLTTFLPLKGAVRAAVVGWICVAVSVSVFAAPLSIVFRVVRTKSVEFMPFTLSFFLTLSAIMWFGYGCLLKDLCVALPNIMGFFLGLFQMLLYAIYRNGPVEQKLQVPEHVINMVMVGAPEVHPVDSQSDEDQVVDEEEVETAENSEISVDFVVEERDPTQDWKVKVQIEPPVVLVCAA